MISIPFQPQRHQSLTSRKILLLEHPLRPTRTIQVLSANLSVAWDSLTDHDFVSNHLHDFLDVKASRKREREVSVELATTPKAIVRVIRYILPWGATHGLP